MLNPLSCFFHFLPIHHYPFSLRQESEPLQSWDFKRFDTDTKKMRQKCLIEGKERFGLGLGHNRRIETLGGGLSKRDTWRKPPCFFSFFSRYVTTDEAADH